MSNIQLPTFAYVQLLDKPCENEVILIAEHNLKMLLASSALDVLWEGFRSFYTGNKESVCQWDAKLPAIKVVVFKKKSAALAITTVCKRIWPGSESNPSKSLMDCNFAAL